MADARNVHRRGERGLGRTWSAKKFIANLSDIARMLEVASKLGPARLWARDGQDGIEPAKMAGRSASELEAALKKISASWTGPVDDSAPDCRREHDGFWKKYLTEGRQPGVHPRR